MNDETIENGATTQPSTEAENKARAHEKGQACQESEAAKKPKPKAERVNKKAEVITVMKRAEGATLAEITKATGCQPHTVRSLVSMLGKNGGEKVESSKSAYGERIYKIK